jgi:hydroxymethylpyrimidine kinase/phosphomethylpyrimidine kinase
MTAEASRRQPPVVLSVAGSDSGGGAGIQADLKTFHAFGAFGTTAVTAITAQNTLGVQAVHPVPVPIVRLQIEAVVNDLAPAAVKTGMLATAELVAAVADSIRQHALPNFVLDPVMVATSGDRLLDADAEGTLFRELLPLALLVTPNLAEAALLTGSTVGNVEQMRIAAARLVASGAGAALVKGGHLPGSETVDVLWDGERFHEWRHPRVDTRSTHGTGCTLSAAIAAGLSHGRPLLRAVDDALGFVRRAIIAAPGLGSGNGPLSHFVGLTDHEDGSQNDRADPLSPAA